MKKKFCECQFKCKEDTDDTWTCVAHIDSGRVEECPYESMTDAKTRPYPCEDAEMPKGMPGCLAVVEEVPA